VESVMHFEGMEQFDLHFLRLLAIAEPPHVKLCVQRARRKSGERFSSPQDIYLRQAPKRRNPANETKSPKGREVFV
jgi:hypothetical protein